MKNSQVSRQIYQREEERHNENLLGSTGILEQELDELLNWNPVVAAHPDEELLKTGEVPIEGFCHDTKTQVEGHLSSLARKLHERVSSRLMILPITLSESEAFAGDFTWIDLCSWWEGAKENWVI